MSERNRSMQIAQPSSCRRRELHERRPALLFESESLSLSCPAVHRGLAGYTATPGAWPAGFSSGRLSLADEICKPFASRSLLYRERRMSFGSMHVMVGVMEDLMWKVSIYSSQPASKLHPSNHDAQVTDHSRQPTYEITKSQRHGT